MAYQNPAFMVAHPLSGLAISDITTDRTDPVSDENKRAWIDSRQGELGSWTVVASPSDTFSGPDFDTSGISSVVDWCVIPAGHTFDGVQISIVSDAGGGGVSRAAPSVTGASVLDLALGGPWTDHIKWGFDIVPASEFQTFGMGEFWVGQKVTITNADVQPGFTLEWVHQINETVMGGRDVAVEIAPPRRRFTLSLRYVDPADSDFTILEEVIRLGRSAPFWYWTPDSTDTGPYLVKLTAAAGRVQESSAPQAGIFYLVDLTMIEQTT